MFIEEHLETSVDTYTNLYVNTGTHLYTPENEKTKKTILLPIRTWGDTDAARSPWMIQRWRSVSISQCFFYWCPLQMVWLHLGWVKQGAVIFYPWRCIIHCLSATGKVTSHWTVEAKRSAWEGADRLVPARVCVCVCMFICVSVCVGLVTRYAYRTVAHKWLWVMSLLFKAKLHGGQTSCFSPRNIFCWCLDSCTKVRGIQILDICACEVDIFVTLNHRWREKHIWWNK